MTERGANERRDGRERDALKRAGHLRCLARGLIGDGRRDEAARLILTAEKIETRVMAARNRRIDARASA